MIHHQIWYGLGSTIQNSIGLPDACRKWIKQCPPGGQKQPVNIKK
jgi:hypothetical protein